MYACRWKFQCPYIPGSLIVYMVDHEAIERYRDVCHAVQHVRGFPTDTFLAFCGIVNPFAYVGAVKLS